MYYGDLSDEMTEDIFRTLYGMEQETFRHSDAFFREHVELGLGFVDENEPGSLYTIALVLPFGTVVAKYEDWQALCARITAAVSEQVDRPLRMASRKEIQEFWEAEELRQQFSMTPPEGMA